MKLALWQKIALAVLVLLFAAFVWPTPYRYEQTGGVTSVRPLERGVSYTSLVRINRFTGSADELGDYGWYRLKPPKSGR